MYAALLVSVLSDNIHVIEQAMGKLHFFRANPTDKQLLEDIKGCKWIDLRFEPNPSNELK